MDKPLIPALRNALPGQQNLIIEMSPGFEQTDKLHVINETVAGHLAGSVVPILGQCISRETPTSPPYALVAYVPVSPTVCIAYAERSAAHFEADQHIERWFSGVQLYFAEIDITDYAESLALERTALVATPSASTEKPTRTLYVFTWSDPDQQKAA
jgi:hypothetical protein